MEINKSIEVVVTNEGEEEASLATEEDFIARYATSQVTVLSNAIIDLTKVTKDHLNTIRHYLNLPFLINNKDSVDNS